ncbi:MAG TPA: hypothetical protein VD886_00905 [Herpetosiphonaceae bacterium]|nr:hypothetical protein [Herpetosiphonaceae bacterium]
MFKKLFGKAAPPVDVAPLEAALAQVRALDARGEIAAALELARATHDQAQQVLDRDNPLLALTRQHLATLYMRTAQPAAAEPLYQANLEAVRRALPRSGPMFAKVIRELIGLYQEQGRYAEAAPLLAELARHQEAAGSADLGDTLLDHVETALKLNNLAEAEGAIRKVRMLMEGFDFRRSYRMMYLAGQTLMLKGDRAAARKGYELALKYGELHLGQNHPDLIPLRTALAGAQDTGEPR